MFVFPFFPRYHLQMVTSRTLCTVLADKKKPVSINVPNYDYDYLDGWWRMAWKVTIMVIHLIQAWWVVFLPILLPRVRLCTSLLEVTSNLASYWTVFVLQYQHDSNAYTFKVYLAEGVSFQLSLVTATAIWQRHWCNWAFIMRTKYVNPGIFH